MGRPILYDATAVRLTSRSGGADDNFLDFEDGRNAPVSNAGEARMRLGAAGIEHSYNGGAYQGLGGFDRIHYLANTATEADVQAALNDPRYDIVALEAGAWANPFAANLTIPAGKLLVGFSWTGDADDLPTLTFTGTAQILMNGSRMESLKLIHLNTRTAGLVVGSGDGAWIERVFIQTSDGNFYNYWAVSGVVRRMEELRAGTTDHPERLLQRGLERELHRDLARSHGGSFPRGRRFPRELQHRSPAQ